MKLSSVAVALLACTASVSAQYFSDGWAPGKPITDEPPKAAPTPAAAPNQPKAQPRATGGGGFFDKFLESGPVSSLFNKAGINISQHLEAARQQPEVWDPRIPLITDANYESMIVNETLTEEEKEKRLWFIVISAQTTGRSPMSKGLDENFDSAYNTSIIEGDLPDVRWARIDYLNVTYLTTKWNVWQAPYIVLIRDQGRTLYFYQANHVRLTADVLRSFLLEESWKQTNAWDAPWAPGGDYEYVLHYLALSFQYTYNAFVVLPRWVIMIGSGAVASFLMRFLHRAPEEAPKPEVKKPEEKVEAPPAPETEKSTKATTTATPTKSGKSRKGGKK